MDSQSETILAPSFFKALILSAAELVVFLILCRFVLGIQMEDPFFKIFLSVLIIVMIPTFAAFTCFLVRCRIDEHGLHQESFVLFGKILLWSEVKRIQGRSFGLFYVAYGNRLNDFCVLPGPLLLKHPDRLKHLIQQYAPADNVVRRKLVP